MTTEILPKSAMLLLAAFLFSFTTVGGEGSAEGFQSGESEGSGGNEQKSEQETTNTITSCGPRNLNASVEHSRSLHSPNYPESYPPNMECWWTITAPLGFHVQINFTTFELEWRYDFLQVNDVASQANVTQPYWKISSVDVPSSSILSHSNYFTMKFKSDQFVQKQGFELTYMATTVSIACPTLSIPSNGSKLCFIGQGNMIHCKFYCNILFKFSGSERRWCKANRNWTGNEGTCVEITSCDELPVPEHGRKRCTNGNKFSSTCNITCNDGYKLFGSDSRKCKNTLRDEFRWTGVDTSCQGSPPTPTCNLYRMNVCDGYSQCSDHSDEKGCTCPHYKFKCGCFEYGCRSTVSCISQSWRCNGYDECGDRSDERNCQCADTRFQCKYGECIDRSKVNDGSIDCVLGDDEFICNKTQEYIACECIDDDDRCTSSGRCIPNSWIGDAIPDCENHNDEPCNATKVWCDECWVIINKCSTKRRKNVLIRNFVRNKTRCHSLTNPTNPMQLLEANWICITSPCGKCLDVFQCENGQYIDNEQYCDGIRQCLDGSDETSKIFGFRCRGKMRRGSCVLTQKNIYDDVAQCADDSDLCFLNGEFRCFSCLDGKLIVSANQVCDGIVDCYDMSDECLCANQTVCNAVLGEKQTRCPSKQMHCNTGNDCVDMDKVLCNSSVSCQSGSNRMFCHQKKNFSESVSCFGIRAIGIPRAIIAARCDGRPDCDQMQDECYCEPRPSFCDNKCAYVAKFNWVGNRVCDGYVNRVNPSHVDPFCDREVEKNCSMRFYCKSKDMISIDKSLVCDGLIDCDDHSDENNTDCRNTQVSLFSDQYEMISNSILRALFWVMGLLAIIGNSYISVETIKDIFSYKKNNLVKLANNIFILNLTISDFLMGVYLIAVVAQGQKYSGYYGLVDKKWRSSNFCSGLGTLAVLSSETSTFIMASMSSLRLITVYRPFLSNSIKIKWIVIAGCSCWLVSSFLAAIPLFSNNSGYFISDLWFPNAVFKTDTVSKSDMVELSHRVSGENYDHRSWFEVKKIVSDAFKYNPIKGEFGYYGETSVCMPRLYATTNEAAWQYSTFLITLNFVLFICMVIAYVLVYKKVNSMNHSRSGKKDRNKGMQKRVSRLLLTDFCCWIPVCMMGYLSVAGVSLPPTAYLASAGFLLPINSAMNPILYSKFIGHQVSQAKKWIMENLSKVFGHSYDHDAGAVERGDARREEIQLRVIEVPNN